MPTKKKKKVKAKPQAREGDLLRFVEDLKRQWMSTIDALVDPLMIVCVKRTYSLHNVKARFVILRYSEGSLGAQTFLSVSPPGILGRRGPSEYLGMTGLREAHSCGVKSHTL